MTLNIIFDFTFLFVYLLIIVNFMIVCNDGTVYILIKVLKSDEKIKVLLPVETNQHMTEQSQQNE